MWLTRVNFHVDLISEILSWNFSLFFGGDIFLKKGVNLKVPHAFKCQILFLLLSPAMWCYISMDTGWASTRWSEMGYNLRLTKLHSLHAWIVWTQGKMLSRLLKKTSLILEHDFLQHYNLWLFHLDSCF